MERHLLHPAQGRQERDAEEEERQGPQRHGQEDGHDLEDLRRRDRRRAEDVGFRKHVDAGVGDADEGEACEGWRADADEHSRAGVGFREAVGHEASDVVAVHEDGD